MKLLKFLGCAVVALASYSPSFAQPSGTPAVVCPRVTASAGYEVTSITAAPNGRWTVNLISLPHRRSTAVITIDRSTRAADFIGPIEWYPCSAVHPRQPSIEETANILGAILSIPGIVRPGIPRSDLRSETVYDRINRIAAEDERDRQARMQRDAAQPLTAYIGITSEDVTSGMATAYSMDRTAGEWIKILQPEGPAATAGLLPADIILTVNDQPVGPTAGVRLVDVIPSFAVGSTVRVEIFRRNVGIMSFDVVLGGRRQF